MSASQSSSVYRSVVPNGCREKDGPRIPPKSPMLVASRRRGQSSQSPADALTDVFPGLNLEAPVTDYLSYMPHNTPTKINDEDGRRKAYKNAYKDDDMPEWFQSGRGILPHLKLAEKDASNRPLHVHGNGIGKPWRPSSIDSNQMKAHEEYAILMEQQPSPVPSIFDDDTQSSWKDRIRISQLTDSRKQYLRNWYERDSELRQQVRGAQLPSGLYATEVEATPEAIDLLLKHDATKTGRRIAVPWKLERRTKGELKARRKMHEVLSDFFENNDDEEINDLASTLPERVEHGLSVRTDITQIKDYYEIVKTSKGKHKKVPIPLKEKREEEKLRQRRRVGDDEEYDTLAFSDKDELEDMMQEPNVQVGIYDKAEVEYEFHLMVKETVEQMKRDGHDGTSIDAFLGDYRLSEEALEANLEAAKLVLVQSRKLLPSDTGTQAPPQRQSPTRRQSAAQRQHRAQRPSPPKKRPPPNKQAAGQKQPQRRRPPNQGQPQVQARVVTAPAGIVLPAPDCSPITLVGDNDIQRVPEGLEQLDGPSAPDRERSATLSVVSRPSSMETLAGSTNEMSLVDGPEPNGDGMPPVLEERNALGDEDRDSSIERLVAATERPLPTRGTKRKAVEESQEADEDLPDGNADTDDDLPLAQRPRHGKIIGRVSSRTGRESKKPRRYV